MDQSAPGVVTRAAAGHASAITYPRYRPDEIRADRWVHVVGVGIGSVGALGLLTAAALRSDAWLVLGVGIYALGLLAMLSLSASYNLVSPSPIKENLRRFDHAAIFTMIAGTYTPFFLNRVGGGWAAGMLSFVWVVALAGALLAIAAPRRHEKLQIAVCLLLGWSVVIARQPLGEHLSETAGNLLIAGGLVYSLGVPVHLWRKLRFNNAIWHALVLIAAGCHYIAVLIGVVLAD
jgi:hemolysin III